MKLFTNPDATIAYGKGVVDGTIKDTVEQIYHIVCEQEVVSYASDRGCYTFDLDDFQEGDA